MLDIFLPCFLSIFLSLLCIVNSFNLSTLKIVNLTKDLNITSPGTSILNVTNAFEDGTGCFHQSPPHDTQLSRTNFVDCFNAEKKIAGYDTHRPIRFHRNDDTAFVLPNSFTYRTCVIFVDMMNADAEDFFYVGQIRDVAIDTARRCTAIPQALGGRGIVGPKRLMEVLVLGRLWPLANGGMDPILLENDVTVA